MKTIAKGKPALILIGILLLVWPLYHLAVPIGPELLFRFSEPTQAEIAVHSYAHENGLRYSDYPQSIIRLLERNPETETFVLEYPLKKDLTPDIDLTEETDSDSVPLFLQWDQRWGYLPYGSDVAGITGCGPLCLPWQPFTSPAAMIIRRIKCLHTPVRAATTPPATVLPGP